MLPEQYDVPGRKWPFKFSSTTWMKMFGANLEETFTGRVPDEMWASDVTDDEQPLAVVACVCGHEPRVTLANFQRCECERTFWFLGGSVRVATLDEEQPEGDEASAPA